MTAPDPMPLVERLRKTAHAMEWGYATSADNVPLPDVLRKVADEIERLTAALEAEKAEVFRLQASHSALYAEVEALRDALAQAKGVPADWKLVPVEPTPEMLRAAVCSREGPAVYKVLSEGGLRTLESEATDDYRAMLAATPPSPAQAAGWRDIESAPRVLPHPASVEASAMLDSMLNFYQWPANPKNAARAGWEAARKWLDSPLPAAPGHPPSERQGLAKDQIDFILSDSFLAANGSVYSTRVYDFVQAIERAHGIGIVPATPEQERT